MSAAAAASASSSSSDGRASLDTAPAPTNGKSPSDHGSDTEETWQDISSMTDAAIRTELARVREERDTFESQYRSLLSKLTTMRATLGDRLRQDAEELDRREAQIEGLTAKVAEFEANAATLREEVVVSHAETDRLTNEVDALRKDLAAKTDELSRRESIDSGLGGRLERERELHELVERVKLDSSNWQASALEEKAKREDLESQLLTLQQALDKAQQSEAHHRRLAEREAASAANLSAVLAEFQSTQESELARALGDSQSQIDSLTSSLHEFQQRAETAESQLQQNADLAAQAEKYAAQVKEKNLLIGKLRHEAVILNEHLTEALRRLRNDQSDSNVDKRLVTNLLISFLGTPRADGKRYEMLNLIAGVLGWKDDEREAAGLQKGAGGASGSIRPSLGARAASASGSRRISGSSGAAAAAGNGAVGADESFSNLFVEFLISEAESGKSGKDGEAAATTAPTTPSLPAGWLSPSRLSFGGGGGAEPGSLSLSDSGAAASAGLNGEDATGGGARSGGIGSYFGLSRGKK